MHMPKGYVIIIQGTIHGQIHNQPNYWIVSQTKYGLREQYGFGKPGST